MSKKDISTIRSINTLLSYNKKMLAETVSEIGVFPTESELHRVILLENEIRKLQAILAQTVEEVWAA